MIVKYLLSFICLILIFSFGGSQVDTIPDYRDSTFTFSSKIDKIDSLQRSLDTLQHIITCKVDTLKSMSEYLKWAKNNPHYRIYTYSNPRIKLIYKKKGIEGKYELIKKVNY